MTDSKTLTEDLERLTRPDAIANISTEAMAIIQRAEESHNHKRGQIQQIIDAGKNGATIKLSEDGPTFEPGTDEYDGFIAGMRVAHSLMGEFPLKFKDDNG